MLLGESQLEGRRYMGFLLLREQYGNIDNRMFSMTYLRRNKMALEIRRGKFRVSH